MRVKLKYKKDSRHQSGVNNALKSQGVQNLIRSQVERIANQANSMVEDDLSEPAFICGVELGEQALGFVSTYNIHAKRAEAKHRILQKCL